MRTLAATLLSLVILTGCADEVAHQADAEVADVVLAAVEPSDRAAVTAAAARYEPTLAVRETDAERRARQAADWEVSDIVRPLEEEGLEGMPPRDVLSVAERHRRAQAFLRDHADSPHADQIRLDVAQYLTRTYVENGGGLPPAAVERYVEVQLEAPGPPLGLDYVVPVLEQLAEDDPARAARLADRAVALFHGARLALARTALDIAPTATVDELLGPEGYGAFYGDDDLRRLEALRQSGRQTS